MFRLFFLFSLIHVNCVVRSQQVYKTDVLVVGGGTGGTAAALQAVRSGSTVLLAEEGPWLGGMISAAGVSATDGNHQLPSGIWKEFRDQIYDVYGGAGNVATGWVSNTQFEPHVADSIFKRMTAAEKKLNVQHGWRFHKLSKRLNRIQSVWFLSGSDTILVTPRMVIDATEMGDVLAAAGEPFDLGMEAGSVTGERVGVKESNAIIQDLTYVAILKYYGPAADCTIVKPANYTPAEFDGACTDYYTDTKIKKPTSTAKQMLDYGKLPNNKYLINWPIKGNDTYLDVVELPYEQRHAALETARQKTLRFIYFIQSQLGFKHLGLADDEFPTADRLALMPYYREGRRLKGLVRFTINHISDPFGNGQPLYRTGIAVGDYPIDHHHKENPAAPQHLDFYPVPSFNVPIGSLLPRTTENLIVAEKGISVSNVVNGTTRLQPCVMLTGQAAGMIASLSVRLNARPSAVSIRTIQQALLKAKCYLMPYLDVIPDSLYFESVQRIGATGILRGTGIPYKWANQTWFYPDSMVHAETFRAGWRDFSSLEVRSANSFLTVQEALQLVKTYVSKQPQNPALTNDETIWTSCGLRSFQPGRPIFRKELAVLIDKIIDPFSVPVSVTGHFKTTKASH